MLVSHQSCPPHILQQHCAYAYLEKSPLGDGTLQHDTLILFQSTAVGSTASISVD